MNPYPHLYESISIWHGFADDASPEVMAMRATLFLSIEYGLESILFMEIYQGYKL